jgi:hypothetical protein
MIVLFAICESKVLSVGVRMPCSSQPSVFLCTYTEEMAGPLRLVGACRAVRFVRVKNFFKFLLIFEDSMCYNQSRDKERDVPKETMKYGALAQLGERYTGSVEVSGSNPLCSTITHK